MRDVKRLHILSKFFQAQDRPADDRANNNKAENPKGKANHDGEVSNLDLIGNYSLGRKQLNNLPIRTRVICSKRIVSFVINGN